MKLHPLNKLVTDSFSIQTGNKENPVDYVSGFGNLAATLVRAGAQKIYVPAVMVAATSYLADNVSLDWRKKWHAKEYDHVALLAVGALEAGKFVDDAIKNYPPTLANRIQVVDRNGHIYKKTRAYVEPVLEDLKNLRAIEPYYILAFLYKLALASKLEAEVDVGHVGGGVHIGEYLRKVSSQVKDEEAKARLDALQGVWSIYSSPKKIDALTLVPKIVSLSVRKRISDLLDEAEVMELSKSRYLLGVPGKARSALIRIKRSVREILENQRYFGYIKAATDLVRVGSVSLGLPLTLPDPSLLEGIIAKGYNPPLIDLSIFKRQFVWRDEEVPQ